MVEINTSRRDFLKYAAASFASLAVFGLDGCRKSPQVRLSAYLIENPRVAQAMKLAGGQTFNNWPEKAKAKLLQFFTCLDEGRILQFSFSTHLPFIADDQMAEEIYLAYTAHALWLEINHKVPWRLNDYDNDSLDLLLNYNKLYNGAVPNYDVIGRVVPSNPTAAYGFMARNPEGGSLLGKTQQETLFALTNWMLLHLNHGLVTGSSSDPTIEDMIKRQIRPGEKGNGRYLSPLGCHSAAGFMVMTLKAVNIPAMKIEGWLGPRPENNHSGLAVPFLGLYLQHTDNIYALREWRYGFPTIDPKDVYLSRNNYLANFGPGSDPSKREIAYIRQLHSMGCLQPTYYYLNTYHSRGRGEIENIVSRGNFNKGQIDEMIKMLEYTLNLYGGFGKIQAEYDRLEAAR